MTSYADYKAILASNDYSQQLSLLALLRPDLSFQIADLQRKKNVTKVVCFLQAERNNALIAKPEINIKVLQSPKVERLRNPIESDFKSSNDFENYSQYNYPEHYPPILQSKLIEANNLTQQKRQLSNSLYGLQQNPNGLGEAVNQILLLSESIDKIYAHKENFDTHGYLPKEWTDKLDELPNSLAELNKRLDSVKRRIREYSAKLNNFNECMQAGEVTVGKWREIKKKYESEKYELIDKIATHK